MPLDAPVYDPDAQPKRGLRTASLTVPGARRGIAEAQSQLARTQGGRPFLGERDMVVVESLETDKDVVWRFEWDRRQYDLKPGATMHVPFPAVINALGDPRSVEGAEVKFRTEDGEVGIIQSRYDTLMTLMARYGIKEENVDALVDFAPKVRVRTLTGTEIVFPTQNPRAMSWPTPHAPEPGREQPTDMRELIQRYEEERTQREGEMAEMRNLVNDLLNGRPSKAASPAAEALLGSTAEDVTFGGAVPDSGPRTQV